MPAKKGKLNTSQIDQMQEMSLEDLKGSVLTNQKRLESLMSNPQIKQQLFQEEEQLRLKESSPSSPEDFDVDKFILKYSDPATLEARPDYANGSSAATAINRSPLGLMDRMKLSIGDSKGTMNYLKERYSEVQPMRSGSLAVKDKDGLWYQVDPQGSGQGDAWERSKEIAKDILGDYAGTIGTTAAVIGSLAAAPMTGGASVVAAGSAGLGAALTRTSLGRLVGTYDATPEEQLKDVAIETLLNAGGQGIALGIKPTAQYMGSLLKRGAQNLKGLPEASKEVLAKVQGFMSGAGEDVARTWIDKADEVGSALIEHGKGQISSESVIQNITQRNVTLTKDIANETRTGLTKWYSSKMDEIINEAGGKFNPKVSTTVKESLSEYAEKGFGEMMPNGTFKLKPLKDLLAKEQAAGSVTALTDPKGYRLLEDFVNHVNKFSNQAEAAGKDGVLQLVKFEQGLGQKLRELSLEAAETGGREAIDLIKNVKINLENKLSSNISKNLSAVKSSKDIPSMFSNIQKQYSVIKDAVNPILDAHTLAMRKGSTEAYSNLYNNLFKVSALSPKGAMAKGGLDTAMFALGQFSPGIAKNVSQIGVNKAAMASLPLVKPGLVGQGALVGGMVGGLVNPAIAAPAVAMSPRLNYQAAKMAGSALKGLNFLQTLDPNMKMQLFQNPKALSQFMSTVVNAPQIQDGVKNELMGQALGASSEQR